MADRLVYVSRLVHLPLLGADEAEIGRMADVVLGAPVHAAPPVHGFVVAVHPQEAGTAWFVPAVKDECRVPVGAKLTLIDQSPYAEDPCAIIDLVRQASAECANAVVLVHALGARHKIAPET